VQGLDGARAVGLVLDQLLGYATWRDGKTALVRLRRGKAFSGVVRAVPEAVRAHSSFTRDLGPRGETSHRFVLTRPDDRALELVLTTLAFHLPARGASSSTDTAEPT
jgi:hypothetical protein